VDADPLPFPPPSLPRLPLLLHPSHPFLSLLLFPSSRKFSKEVWGSTTVSFPQCPAKRKQPVAKVGGDQIHLVPKVGGDASHGSHIAVAPIVTGLLQKIMQRTDIRPLLDAFPLRTRSAYVSAVLSEDTCYRTSGRLGRCIGRALVPWPTRVYPPLTPNGISVGSAGFAQPECMPNTDHATCDMGRRCGPEKKRDTQTDGHHTVVLCLLTRPAH